MLHNTNNPFVVLIIADRNALRTALVEQIADRLNRLGVTNIRFEWRRTAQKAISWIFSSPLDPPDIIFCWDSQPSRDPNLFNREAYEARPEGETERLLGVLRLYPHLLTTVIGARVPIAQVPEDSESDGAIIEVNLLDHGYGWHIPDGEDEFVGFYVGHFLNLTCERLGLIQKAS